MNNMETYDINTTTYEVFSANMTLDTRGLAYYRSELSACKSCQCNCRLCLGGMAPDKTKISAEVDAEKGLAKLLAA